jgi:5-formyltetrahydrofolate cyclo-ligase
MLALRITIHCYLLVISYLYLVRMLKSEARKIYKEKRTALSVAERTKLDDLLLIQLQKVELPFITFLLSYWPVEDNHEPHTHLFTDYLEFRNPDLVVCYPRTDFSSQTLSAVQTNDDTRFRKNKYNIYEPEAGDMVNPAGIDLVFVPLLAFDKKGYRAGYGRGFYDRYLPQCRTDCLRIGFSYFEPLDQLDDRSEFDVPLNLCVTPATVYAF